MKKINILIADDHPIVRKGFVQVIRMLNFVGEIIEAENGEHVLDLAGRNKIDLFILDFKMPGIDGYDTARFLLKNNPSRKIIIMTMYDDAPLIINLFRIGVKGFIVKNTDIEEIDEAIQKVMYGDLYYNKSFDKIILNKLYRENIAFALKFTPREKNLVHLISKGDTSREIAQKWGLRSKSVETYRSRLLEKVGVKNTSELLSYFHQNGLI